MIEHLASKIYETYCKAVGGKAFNGDPLPDWKTFRADPAKKKQSDAWVETAMEALRGIGRTNDVEECRQTGNDTKQMGCGIGMPQTIYLQSFGDLLMHAFDGEVPYHVGSSLKSSRKGVWRDVDVRVMLDREKYESLGFGDSKNPHDNAKWCAYALAFSELGRRMTGLPIDFQVQETQSANAEYRGVEHHPRSALILMGIRRTIEGDKRLRDGASVSFIPVAERMPAPCLPVIGYSPRWVNEDYNPRGLRECFRMDDGTWISAIWNNVPDCYDTETDQGPESWMPFPVPR